jgi:Recombinase zinc beta ribbon domain
VSEVREGAVYKRQTRRPMEEWRVLIRDHHEGYIGWDDFQRIQRMLKDNGTGFRTQARGAAKKGAALLSGLLRCRRCGRKLMVSYTGTNSLAPRYYCHRGRLDNAEPGCISLGATPVDEAVSREADDLYKLLVAASIRLSPGHPSVVLAGHPTKDYCLVPEDRSQRGKHITRMRTFLSTPDIEGVITLQVTNAVDPNMGKRSFCQGDTLYYNIDSLQEDMRAAPAGYTPTGGTAHPPSNWLQNDSDGVPSVRFTLAHELNHVLGVPDDYYEQLDPTKEIDANVQWNKPALPAYNGYKGWQSSARPYNADQKNLMYEKGVMRLRHLWHHTRMLSSNSSVAGVVPDRPYVPRHRTFATTGIDFKTRADVSPWDVIAEGHLPGGHAELALFALGDDEGSVEAMFAQPIPAGSFFSLPIYLPLRPSDRFHGIVAVRTYYRFVFDDSILPSTGAFPPSTDPVAQRKWMTMFKFYENHYADYYRLPRIRFMLEGGHRFSQNSASASDRIAIVVQPHFAYGPPGFNPFGPPDKADFRLNISETTGTPCPLLKDHPGTTLDLAIADVHPLPILRLALGERSWKLAGTSRTVNTDPISQVSFESVAHAVEDMLDEPRGTRTARPM